MAGQSDSIGVGLTFENIGEMQYWTEMFTVQAKLGKNEEYCAKWADNAIRLTRERLSAVVTRDRASG